MKKLLRRGYPGFQYLHIITQVEGEVVGKSEVSEEEQKRYGEVGGEWDGNFSREEMPWVCGILVYREVKSTASIKVLVENEGEELIEDFKEMVDIFNVEG